MRQAWLQPLTLATLAVFWIGTGVIALVSLLQAAEQLGLAGLSAGSSRAIVQGVAVIDIALGVMVLIPRTRRPALIGMVLMSLAYVIGGTVGRRDLWFDPLGPLLKMLPVSVLAMAALAMTHDR